MSIAAANCACNRTSHFAIPETLTEQLSIKRFAFNLVIHYEQGDMEDAASFARLITNLGGELAGMGETSSIRSLMHTQTLLAMVLSATDHVEEARDFYQGVIDSVNQPGLREKYQEEVVDALWGVCLCDFDLHNYQKFAYNAGIFKQLSSPSCPCYHDIRSHLLTALQALHEGHWTTATISFQNVLQIKLSSFYHAVALMGLAEVAGRQQETVTAQQYSEQADRKLHSGLWGALIAWRERFPTVIAIAKQYGYKWPVEPSPSPYLGVTKQVAQPQAEIELHTFGRGSLFIFGQEITAIHQAPHLKTLMTFMAMTPEGMMATQIKTHIWPGVPSNDALTDAIRRLRACIGDPECKLLTYDRLLYQLKAKVWVDVVEYERLRIAAGKATDPDDRYAGLKTATGMYAGPFLNGVTGNVWVEEQRLKLQNAQAWMLTQMAQYHYERGHFAEARDFLNLALKQNPIYDQAVQQLMRLFDELDERTEAIQLYKNYGQRIAEHYGPGVRPSPKLQSLYARWMENPDNMVTGPFMQKQFVQPGAQRLPAVAAPFSNSELAGLETLALLTRKSQRPAS